MNNTAHFRVNAHLAVDAQRCAIQDTTRTRAGLIRVYGDSLSLPRWEDGIHFSDTYPERVRQHLHSAFKKEIYLYNRSLGGATIDQLHHQYVNDCKYFGDCDDIIIIQAGIVDCAPRPLGRRTRSLVGTLPFPIKRRLIAFLHNHRAQLLRSGLGSRFTTPRRFAAILRQWFSDLRNRHSQIIFINIAPTLPHIEAHSPGLTANICEYNKILADLVGELQIHHLVLIDAYSAIEARGKERFISYEDGHHITLEGHHLYAELIIKHGLTTFGQTFQNQS